MLIIWLILGSIQVHFSNINFIYIKKIKILWNLLCFCEKNYWNTISNTVTWIWTKYLLQLLPLFFCHYVSLIFFFEIKKINAIYYSILNFNKMKVWKVYCFKLEFSEGPFFYRKFYQDFLLNRILWNKFLKPKFYLGWPLWCFRV